MSGVLSVLLPPAQRALVVSSGRGAESGSEPQAPVALSVGGGQSADALGLEMNPALVPSWKILSAAMGEDGHGTWNSPTALLSAKPLFG